MSDESQIRNDGLHHVHRSGFPLKVRGVDEVHADRFVDGFGDKIGMEMMPQMLQHINGCVQHGDGIGNIFSSNSST